MKRRFEGAIRQVGDDARLSGGGSFTASIQPLDLDGDELGETGAGQIRGYKIYTACDGAAALVKDGDTLEVKDERYYVKHIETMCFRGMDVYRRGVLILEREGGYS